MKTKTRKVTIQQAAIGAFEWDTSDAETMRCFVFPKQLSPRGRLQEILWPILGAFCCLLFKQTQEALHVLPG